MSCELHQDGTWQGQYCAAHDVWFRASKEPTLCPAGEVECRSILAGERNALDAIRALRNTLIFDDQFNAKPKQYTAGYMAALGYLDKLIADFINERELELEHE